ncbi:hypothetical protein CH293_26405 [Rhodococcus sp. 14-2470-1b]|uniref:diacylglycerol/lipid kinase family protein n=1 Tax=Rhodococcus sp. 14-2470-1b TaxID=2023149 RepID=UPI000B9B9D1A|nr:diacylglycerol kinase family protein [Rhodococcus sp. 14-2470-1b]OZF42266.1 hypothetical protein CH293_26405 [Rhodococcus sp. 14-2470-1b]
MSCAVLIVNEKAGSGRGFGSVVSDVVSLCNEVLGSTIVYRTKGPGDATVLALQARSAQEQPVVVISIGGDGTAREVAQGLSFGNVPLFIVPMGTANSCYRSLWGDQGWSVTLGAALRSCGTGVRYLDLARLVGEDTLIFAGGCLGFPAEAISAAKVGGIGYEPAMANLIDEYRAPFGEVRVDGQPVFSGKILLANVGGSRYRGGKYDLLPYSKMDDCKLDVCVIGSEHSITDILTVAKYGGHLQRPGVVYARGTEITLACIDGSPMWFEHDGEVRSDLGSSVTLAVVPRALPVLGSPVFTPGASSVFA